MALIDDDQFDLAICVTTLEDIRDPIWACHELNRVARAGYVEVPSRLEDASRLPERAAFKPEQAESFGRGGIVSVEREGSHVHREQQSRVTGAEAEGWLETGEGVIAKKAGATYRGDRSRNWLKIKCINRQEFVIVGWARSDKRVGFRSLLLAARDGKALTYVGKVGTGFNTQMLHDLMDRMKPLEVFQLTRSSGARSMPWTVKGSPRVVGVGGSSVSLPTGR